ncbi:hypothetical protein AtNW77_Chr3g0196591 [Arabidopsis thaliana]|uniref:At3g43580 n=1 Tax=Arabidopsis thaliana TaxID=3702 RepID=Q9FYD2_ARATH|nr:Beta-galactosidase related protein [Arabidopsis thaliana]ABL66756.1 At3g43580 [Arabidopsis thaliana]AEE77809.1 Beta-galactosidase related protein [Arabidopsis thaliana]CAC05632.1 hypothetical protein [Arabidopsis thaliana]|eukprot:NP_189944.1 Beta-galactosidase related protein [Arabidopsis thaliana]
MPLKPLRHIIHEVNRLKKNDIIIPFLRSGDYRSFFNLSLTFTPNRIQLPHQEYYLRLSRMHDVASFCAELIFGLKGLWRNSCFTLEGISALPSSLSRIASSLSVFSKWFTPETIETKEHFSKSRILLIVTIVKLPEFFAKVSLTHHDFACDMLRSSCLRVLMDLSPMFNALSTFLATLDVILCLICFMYPTIQLMICTLYPSLV